MTRIRLPAWAALALVPLVLALGACRQEPPAEEARAPGDPVAAVQGLAQAVRDNDLVRYSHLSLPPDLHARSEALWAQRVAEAEPADPEDAARYDEMMARLTAPDAEQALMRDLEPKLAQFESEVGGQWPLMQATAGIFLNAAIQANAELTDGEKAHATAVVAALLAWAQPALITDRARARQAVAAAASTARKLDLPTLADARRLAMPEALAKGGVALAGLKDVGRAYGLDADAALDGMTVRLVSSEGDAATVEVRYPLLGQTIAFEMAMERRDGAWYSADTLRQTEDELAEADAASAAGVPAPAAADGTP